MNLFGPGRDRELEARVDLLSRRLEALCTRLAIDPVGLELDESSAREVRARLAEGKMAEAIKVYRTATGAGLAEARHAIRELADRPE